MNIKDELSQNEVDALLQGINGEAESTVAPALEDSKGPLNHKLGSDERIVRRRLDPLVRDQVGRELEPERGPRDDVLHVPRNRVGVDPDLHCARPYWTAVRPSVSST